MPEPGPYKSPDELGITPEEHAGLIAVMEYLRRPQVVHADIGDSLCIDFVDHDLRGRVGFNMDLTTATSSDLQKYDCSCAACIGGHLSIHLQGVDVLSGGTCILTAEQVEEADRFVDYKRSPVLRNLFYPGDAVLNWGEIKPVTAADAISNFLASGEPDWRAALKRNGQSQLIWGDA